MTDENPTIYQFAGSYFSQKALLALLEKGVSFKRHDVNIGQYENYSEWFMKINPRGQVPVLEHKGKYISDSPSIIKYLDKTFEGPTLMPEAGRERWSYYQTKCEDVLIDSITYGTAVHPHLVSEIKLPWLMQSKVRKMVSTSSRSKKVQEMMDKAGPDMKEIYREKVADAKRMEESMRNEETIKHELEKVRDILSEANEQLAGNKDAAWLCGDDFTVGDICLAILLQRMKILGYGADFWEDGKLPHIEDYYERLLLRKSFCDACVSSIGVKTLLRFVFGEYASMLLGFGAIVALLTAIAVGVYMSNNA